MIPHNAVISWASLPAELVQRIYSTNVLRDDEEIRHRLRGESTCKAWAAALRPLPFAFLVVAQHNFNWIARRKPAVQQLSVSAGPEGLTPEQLENWAEQPVAAFKAVAVVASAAVLVLASSGQTLEALDWTSAAPLPCFGCLESTLVHLPSHLPATSKSAGSACTQALGRLRSLDLTLHVREEPPAAAFLALLTQLTALRLHHTAGAECAQPSLALSRSRAVVLLPPACRVACIEVCGQLRVQPSAATEQLWLSAGARLQLECQGACLALAELHITNSSDVPMDLDLDDLPGLSSLSLDLQGKLRLQASRPAAALRTLHVDSGDLVVNFAQLPGLRKLSLLEALVPWDDVEPLEGLPAGLTSLACYVAMCPPAGEPCWPTLRHLYVHGVATEGLPQGLRHARALEELELGANRAHQFWEAPSDAPLSLSGHDLEMLRALPSLKRLAFDPFLLQLGAPVLDALPGVVLVYPR